jgi:hypothetical protein
MGEITEKLTALLGENLGAPFLFVGSGFSRRYIGLPQWDELLSQFCADIQEFGYYASQSNNEFSKAASLMARDFNEVWWKSPKFADSRAINKNQVREYASALKVEISAYLTEKSYTRIPGDSLYRELEAMPRLNVDGIITTNWDVFLEELFPDYKVFVGQEELLFSNPQSVAEIYKIHGCASQPESLVLTHEDYERFESRNAYLAAKLITIFIEHPVIFIGYRLGDKNIQAIISSIVSCLGQDKLNKFGRNLVFLQRCSVGEVPSYQPSMMNIGETNLNITVIRTNDFTEVFDAVESRKRMIPARILRYCKEQMYDLVRDTESHGKLAVVDIDQIENKEDIEFVVGVGVVDPKDRVTQKGYQGISLEEIFVDILSDETQFDAEQVLGTVYPNLMKQPNRYIPVYRYLRKIGIMNLSDLRSSKHSSIEAIIKKSQSGCHPSYRGQYERFGKGQSTREMIALLTPEKAALLLPFQSEQEIDLSALREFLQANASKLATGKSTYSSYFRKLLCLYDKLTYGFGASRQS